MDDTLFWSNLSSMYSSEARTHLHPVPILELILEEVQRVEHFLLLAR